MKKPASSAAEKALKLRKRVKGKKPHFVRHESWRYVRLKENWRRPRGLDNKMRRKIKGWPPTVSTGYRGPKIARRLHPSGYKEVLVYNVQGLKGIDPETQAIKIAHTVGKRKRTQILVEAKKKKIKILNLGEATETVEREREVSEEEKEATTEEEITEEVEEMEETVEEEPKPKKKRKRRAKKQ